MREKPYFERELCFWYNSDHLPRAGWLLETVGGLFFVWRSIKMFY